MRETHDKIVASFVDFGSIFFAYQIGVTHFGMWAGLGYGMFDAWVVIWQRERISGFVHRAGDLLRQVSDEARMHIRSR